MRYEGGLRCSFLNSSYLLLILMRIGSCKQSMRHFRATSEKESSDEYMWMNQSVLVRLLALDVAKQRTNEGSVGSWLIWVMQISDSMCVLSTVGGAISIASESRWSLLIGHFQVNSHSTFLCCPMLVILD